MLSGPLNSFLECSRMKFFDELRYGILAGSLASAMLILYASNVNGGVGESLRDSTPEDSQMSLNQRGESSR
jgi:hypothetical protein